MSELEPIAPAEAVEWYLDSRATELAQSSLYAHKSRLGHFVRWCDQEDIENLNSLTGRHMDRYKVWRRNDGDLNNVTLHSQLQTLRVFMQFCERIEAVRPGFHEFIQPPEMAPKEGVRHAFLDPDTALEIRDYLRKMQYASRDHVVFELLWHTGIRMGGLVGLDLEDYDPRYDILELHHRPDSGTPLKNKQDGERPIGLAEPVAQILDDYIQYNRLDTEDDYGRNPLLTTEYGRLGRQTVRSIVYGLTRPCTYTGTCPHDTEAKNCRAARSKGEASKCPSTVSPHAIRKGAITYARRNEIPIEEVSGRMNVSPDVIREHYDKNTKSEEMRRRRHYWDTLEDDYE